MEFKITIPKNKKRFWIMFTVFIIMLFFMIANFMVPIVQTFLLVHKINKFIDNNHITTVKDLFEKMNSVGDEFKHLFVHDKNNGDIPTTLKNTWINFGLTYNKTTQTQSLSATFAPAEYLVFNLSYFTTLSNLLVVAVFGICTFKEEKVGKPGLLNSRNIIMTATFITVTFLIFNFALLPVMLTSSKNLSKDDGPAMSSWDWTENSALHIFNPLAFIIYTMFFAPLSFEGMESKKFRRKTYVLEIIILLAYGAYAIIRGGIKMLAGLSATDAKAFPYFFLCVFSNQPLGSKLGFPGAGVVIFLIFVGIIAAISIGASAAYSTLTYRRFNKNKNIIQN